MPTLRTALTLLVWFGLSAVASAKARPVVAKVNDETTSEINDAMSTVDLSGVWFFHDGDNPIFSRNSFDDRTWIPQRIPTERTSWNKRWQGYGWYRRHLYINARATGQEMMLSLGPAREVVEVYINGVLIMQRGRFGSRLRGDARLMPLRTIIPAGVLTPGENVLSLRVYDPSYTGGLPAGPLIIGPPADVSDRVELRGELALAARFALALLALCIALAQILINFNRKSARGEHRWAAAAGFALTFAPLAGTGILTALLPSLDLALRLPVVAQPLSLLFFLNYFASRYDDFGSRRARVGSVLLAYVAGFLFLAPPDMVFFAANPLTLVCGLLTTLYAAHLLAQAARRQEGSTLPVFFSLLTQIGLLVYDGMVVNSSDVMPAGSIAGAVGILAVASLMGARQNLLDQQKTLVNMLSLRKQLDDRVWMDILQATVSSISRPQEFLDAVAHEIAREMGTRRCSIILPNSQGQLYIAASKGLPRQARHSPLASDHSVSRHVFDTGVALTPATLPAELQRKPEEVAMRGNYETQGFVAQPIRGGGRTLGVLNVTDLNTGGSFDSGDEAHVAAVSERLALVLDRLQLTADVILKHAASEVRAVAPRLIRATEPEPEAKMAGVVAVNEGPVSLDGGGGIARKSPDRSLS